MVVPFEQVKAFFKQTETETAVGLRINDGELVLDLGSPTDYAVSLVGISTSWGDYEKLRMSPKAQACGSAGANASATAPGRGHRQNKGAKSDRKRQAQIQSRRDMLNSAVEIFDKGQNYTYFSIDIESWEKNHDIITEVGLTKYLPEGRDDSGKRIGKHISDHIIVKEHRRYKNGDYVADASGNFEFGNSKQVPLAEIKATIATFMDVPENHQRILIGHDINADIEYLRKLGYDDGLKDFAMVLDTIEIWKAVANTFDGISLSRLCRELDISAWNLHNAGNDARYTMEAFLEMISRTAPS